MMRPLSLLLVTLAISPVHAAGTLQEYVLDIRPIRRIEAVLDQTIHAPKLNASEWVLIAPIAPTLSGQTEVKTALDPSGKETTESSELSRPVLRARHQVGRGLPTKNCRVQLHYSAVIRSRRLVSRDVYEGRPPRVPNLERDERRQTLITRGRYSLDSPAVQTWLKQNELKRGEDESDLDYGRRCFLAIKNSFEYSYANTMSRTPQVLCEDREGDCGGLSILFTALMRANDIPARVLVGRWLRSSQQGKEWFGVAYSETHAEAEFWCKGLGWVPVDLASAVLYDDGRPGLKFFGNDPGDFFVQHTDADLILDTVHFGKQTLPWLQSTAWWATGSGSVDDWTSEELWTVN